MQTQARAASTWLQIRSLAPVPVRIARVPGRSAATRRRRPDGDGGDDGRAPAQPARAARAGSRWSLRANTRPMTHSPAAPTRP